MNEHLSPAASAAREAARASDGRFGVQPLDEAPLGPGGIDLGAPADPASLDPTLPELLNDPDGDRDRLRRRVLEALAEEDLPGTFAGDEYGALTYTEQIDGRTERFRISCTEVGFTIRPDIGRGHESWSIRLSGPAYDADYISRGTLAEALDEQRSAVADYRAFADTFDQVWEKDAPMASNGMLAHGHFDEDTASASLVDHNGAQVEFFEFRTARNGEPASLSIRFSGGLDAAREERNGLPERTDDYRFEIHDGSLVAYNESTGAPLRAWEQRGLEAEVNRRAGLTMTAASLTSVLLKSADSQVAARRA